MDMAAQDTHYLQYVATVKQTNTHMHYTVGYIGCCFYLTLSFE